MFPFKYGEHTGAILTAGAGSIGMRTARAVFKKLEQACPATDDCQEVLGFLAEGLKSEMREAYQVEELSKAPVTALEFVFVAFEKNDITKPVISNNLVFSGTLNNTDGTPNNSGHIARWQNLPNRYGACWIGQVEFIAHLVNHNNPRLPPLSGQYHLMTIEDAVNYARFLAELTCDFQDFAITVPECGKPVATAILTPDEFKYVHNPPAL